MSTLVTGTVQSNTTAAPLFKNSSGTEKGQLVKAWVNFDGTFGTSPFTISNGGIRGSYNVSSVTDNGTGNYTINFSITFANTNYVATVMPRFNSRTFGPGAASRLKTTYIDVVSYNGDGSVADRDIFGIVVFGDVNT